LLYLVGVVWMYVLLFDSSEKIDGRPMLDSSISCSFYNCRNWHFPGINVIFIFLIFRQYCVSNIFLSLTATKLKTSILARLCFYIFEDQRSLLY
jgi:hypothetical protein